MDDEIEWRDNMKEIIVAVLLFLLLTGFGGNVHATTIFYEAKPLGGAQWEYDYSVMNSTLGSPLQEFTIWFDYKLFRNLAIKSTNTNWDQVVIQPQVIFAPQDGYYDALTLGTGITGGDSESGFTVSFDWLSNGTPGRQPFDIVDPENYSVLDSGLTTPLNASPVPEPGTILLTALGLVALGGFQVRRRLMG
jgi:hypothetical protein